MLLYAAVECSLETDEIKVLFSFGEFDCFLPILLDDFTSELIAHGFDVDVLTHLDLFQCSDVL